AVNRADHRVSIKEIDVDRGRALALELRAAQRRSGQAGDVMTGVAQQRHHTSTDDTRCARDEYLHCNAPLPVVISRTAPQNVPGPWSLVARLGSRVFSPGSCVLGRVRAPASSVESGSCSSVEVDTGRRTTDRRRETRDAGLMMASRA